MSLRIIDKGLKVIKGAKISIKFTVLYIVDKSRSKENGGTGLLDCLLLNGLL